MKSFVREQLWLYHPSAASLTMVKGKFSMSSECVEECFSVLFFGLKASFSLCSNKMGKGFRHLIFFSSIWGNKVVFFGLSLFAGGENNLLLILSTSYKGWKCLFQFNMAHIYSYYGKCHLLHRNRCLLFIMWSSLAYRYRASRIQLSWVDTRFEEKIIIFVLCRVSYGEGGFGTVSEKLYSVLTRLQMGLTQDKMDWTVELRQKTYWSENPSFTPPLLLLQITINPLVDC